MNNEIHEANIQISLTTDEAVVLFEFVRRFSDTDKLAIADMAEAQALWNLCCIFEKGVLADLEGEWPDLLAQSRMRLRGEDC